MVTKSVSPLWLKHGKFLRLTSYETLAYHHYQRSLSVLGWVPGILTMVGAGILFWITSMTMHKFIMKHPQIRDICDFGYYAFGQSKIAYEFTGFMVCMLQ